MSVSPLRYFFWVLLPVGVALLLSQYLAIREQETQTRVSTSRIGKLAVRLFSEEMGIKAAELALEAPALTNPDPASPLIQAAQRGDTVAALGNSSGELTLSVALAEVRGDSLQIRATTDLFLPAALNLVRSRTGRGVALYLRGRRAAGVPEDFGPEELGTPDPHSTLSLSPLAASGSLASPAQLLVGSSEGSGGVGSLWRAGRVLFLAWGLGLVVWLIISLGRKRLLGPNPSLLILSGLPLLVLWSFLVWTGREIEADGVELQRGDMVRVLALLKEGTIPLAPEDLKESTGFDLLRSEAGEVVASTLLLGPMVAELLALPTPLPTFPSLGTVEAGGDEFVFANLREGPGRTLTLVAPAPGGTLRKLRLLLGGVGGGASLLSLGFLLGAVRKRDG